MGAWSKDMKEGGKPSRGPKNGERGRKERKRGSEQTRKVERNNKLAMTYLVALQGANLTCQIERPHLAQSPFPTLPTPPLFSPPLPFHSQHLSKSSDALRISNIRCIYCNDSDLSLTRSQYTWRLFICYGVMVSAGNK